MITEADIKAERGRLLPILEERQAALDSRLEEMGVSLVYSPDDDELEIIIGEPTALYYTQATDDTQCHFDPETDAIVGMTLERASHQPSPGWQSVITFLRIFREIKIPPKSSGLQQIEREIRELVHA